MQFLIPIFTVPVLILAGCAAPNFDHNAEPTISSYTLPSASGVVSVKPYPNPDDVCQIIKEDDSIREPVDDGSILIACPKHEKGALRDREREGADVIAQAKHWTILTVPASAR
ncbi:MAG: hypothetical protein ABJQ70_22055 [Roseobacter sp.]